MANYMLFITKHARLSNAAIFQNYQIPKVCLEQGAILKTSTGIEFSKNYMVIQVLVYSCRAYAIYCC